MRKKPKPSGLLIAYGEHETVLSAVHDPRLGYLVLLRASLNRMNPKTVMAQYGKPKT